MQYKHKSYLEHRLAETANYKVKPQRLQRLESLYIDYNIIFNMPKEREIIKRSYGFEKRTKRNFKK